MLKMLGAAMLLISGSWLGMAKVKRMKKRMRLLSAMDGALALMSGEIANVGRALPEVFEMLTKHGPEETGDFFRLLCLECERLTAGEAWSGALDFLQLEEDEKLLLKSLSGILGRYDSLRQSSEIESVRRGLASCAESLHLEMESRGRSYPALGMCAAGIAVMLII